MPIICTFTTIIYTNRRTDNFTIVFLNFTIVFLNFTIVKIRVLKVFQIRHRSHTATRFIYTPADRDVN